MNLNHQKLQFLGIYEIFRETIKLIFTARTIFTQITLLFILPLSLLIFTHSELPNLWSIHSLPFNSALFFFFSAVLFFLSTSAAVFAAACTFVDRKLPLHQLIRVAPKICKEHLITFVSLIVDFIAYNVVVVPAFTLICVGILLLLTYESFELLPPLLILLLCVEVFYYVLTWQMSSVVSVFEADSYGYEAIARSKLLVESKMAMASILLILIGFPLGMILFVFRHVVVVESALVRVGILGIVGICSFLMFLLIGTMLYLVCKSNRSGSFDESALSAHLQGYLPVEDSESFKVEDDHEIEKSLQV